ncbi:hypothetical protein DVH24_007791, partial [Malus domestica]
PLSFDYVDSIGNKPKLKLNPYSWTKVCDANSIAFEVFVFSYVRSIAAALSYSGFYTNIVANIIFVDAPVGTGFSYAKTWRGYANMSDTLSAAQTYEFLRKWLMDHPKFFNNPLYIAGDSYSGVVIPLIVQEISDGNLDDNMPPMNVKGYVLGNPATDPKKDENSRILFAYLKALISDELYQSLETNCNGDYVNVDPYNALCVVDLEIYNECTEDIRSVQILEPSCTVSSPKSMGSIWNPDHLSDRDSKNILLTSSGLPRPWCREYNYIFSEIWANDKTVQDALHVQEGSIEEWMRCNKSLEDSNINDVSSSLVYHENLIKQGYRGAGHTAPEYKPEECLAMINSVLLSEANDRSRYNIYGLNLED